MHTQFSSSPVDEQLARLIEETTEKLQTGETVCVERLIADHPQFADELRELWPAIEALVQMGDARLKSTGSKPGQAETKVLP
jgi:hypothetical protein